MAWIEYAGQAEQVAGQLGCISIAARWPVFGWQCDQHAFVAGPDLQGQMVEGHFRCRRQLLIGLLHTTLQQGEDIVG